MKLSVCLAVYNEEKTLHYALDSVKDFADEIVLVDGGSDDDTRKIARSYGKSVRIIEATNPPMFHINKQKAIDAARGDWVLQLDADEQVTEELKREIQEIIAKGEGEGRPVGYWVPRKNLFLDRFLSKGGVYPDYTLRLYVRGKGRLPCKDVHENAHVDGDVGYLKSDLLHYADPDFDRYLMRWNRYTSLDASLLHKQGARLSTVSYFILKPLNTFFSMYIRHRGYVDGFAGFVFALFSSIRYWAIYIKVKMKSNSKHKKEFVV